MGIRKWVSEALSEIGGAIGEKVAIEAIKSGRFDGQIETLVCDVVRQGPMPHQSYTEIGFVVRMAVEMRDRSTKPLSFREAKRRASKAYQEFLRDNGISFGDEGWDWSAAGAVEVIEEYEIRYWEHAA